MSARLLTKQEVASSLGVHPRTVATWAADPHHPFPPPTHRLPATPRKLPDGRVIDTVPRWSADVIEDYLEASRTA